MKKNATRFFLGILILTFVAGLGYWVHTSYFQSDPVTVDSSVEKAVEKFSGEEEEEENRVEAKKARNEYFFKLLRDPATNSIPDNIRSRELRHAQRMPTLSEVNQQLKKNNPSISGTEGFEWRLAGPPAVGGRTRALGIDQRNSDIIVAGGVSGGIWRSTDGGGTWTLRTPNFDSFSVTSLAQDPTNPDTWYYTAGEFDGNSASGPGAFYSGTGVFRSTDNGLTWSRIPGTEDDDASSINSRFDAMSRVVVNPATGTVYVASNGVGILRSPSGTNYDEVTLGGLGEHSYADVTVAPNGTLVAVLSSDPFGEPDNNPGIFVSTNDGQTWDDVTPNNFPAEHFRSVVAIAPSNPNIVYVFSSTELAGPGEGLADEEHSFFMINLSTGNSQDRSENLPNFGGPVGFTASQNGYDMDIIVKPDDPNFVIIGTINLYRSRDGFATGPTGDTPDQRDEFWIGGYAKANDVSQYPNQHPDQHINIFDPTNPSRLWSGHDGGLSVTNDIEATDVNWTERNEGYIVTQFYDVSIGLDEDDTRLMGGAQDNSTPFFRFDEQSQDIGSPSVDIGTGDGSFSFFTQNFIFVSVQNGLIIRWNEGSDGNIAGPFAFVHPSAANGQLFIHPYAVDPNDETIMYYPGGNELFRNTDVDNINNQNNGGTTQGWEEMNAAELSPNFIITALNVSTLNPSNTLYYAGTDASNNNPGPATIMRLDNASSSNEVPTDVSIANAPAGAFVHDIAINPANSNDVLVLMSNYNITGLYHTNNGGATWEAVEGNLTGDNLQGNLAFGPSLRSATIISADDGPIYVLGTSTGVYATQNLDGNNTQWGRESVFDNNGLADIGFSVVENITSRFSDGDVAVGTHGRGIFVGRFQGTIAVPDNPRINIAPAEGRAGDQVTITATNFQFSTTISENEVTFADISAEIVDATSSQLTVIVPRNTLAPTADTRNVLVRVTNPNGADPGPASFRVLPPNENDLGQNFPNPFSVGQGTSIPISLQANSNVTLQIYDTSGRLVDEPLDDDPFQAGTYNIPVNNFNNFASGVYIYRIIAESQSGILETFVDSRKFTFIR